MMGKYSFSPLDLFATPHIKVPKKKITKKISMFVFVIILLLVLLQIVTQIIHENPSSSSQFKSFPPPMNL
jgi:uncharacterized membrane protein